MDVEDFIKEKVEMLNNGFSLSQIKDEVYKHVCKEYMPNITLNSILTSCMSLYSRIILQWHKQENKH